MKTIRKKAKKEERKKRNGAMGTEMCVCNVQCVTVHVRESGRH